MASGTDLATLFPRDPMREVRQERLDKLLFEAPDTAEGEPMVSYLLIDAAASPEIATYVEAFPDPARCLFDGEAFDNLSDVAPWLVQVERYGDALDWFLSKGWGRNWGVFVQSPLPLGKLKTRLKSHLRVSSDEEENMFFKFYRPQTIRTYVPLFEPAQMKSFFLRIESYLVEDENGVQRIWADAEGDMQREFIDLRPDGAA